MGIDHDILKTAAHLSRKVISQVGRESLPQRLQTKLTWENDQADNRIIRELGELMLRTYPKPGELTRMHREAIPIDWREARSLLLRFLQYKGMGVPAELWDPHKTQVIRTVVAGPAIELPEPRSSPEASARLTVDLAAYEAWQMMSRPPVINPPE